MAGVGPSGSEYVDDDLQHAALISNLINPPDEQAQAPQPAQAAPDPRTAVPAGEPPNPTLRTRTPAPAPPTPVPASVTQNGAATGAPKTWADYVRAGLNRGIAASDQSQTALTSIQNQPTAETANAPLEAQRSALAQPLNPNEKEYRPGIGTRIVRGIDAVRRGGVLGAVDPADVGGTRYGAPNTQYQIDTNRRAQQVGSLDQQMGENLKNQAADTARLKDIASEQRAQATADLDIGKTATGQEGAENKQEQTKLQDQLLQVRQQLADQGGTPKTYEQATIASNDPDLSPAKRKQYADSAKQISATEIKRFQYAAKANADPYDDRRQSLIDDATQQIKGLQDKFQYDPDANTYSDPNSPMKTYTPEEYTDMKNQISAKLDKDLATKKLRPLRVRFDAKDAGAGKNATAPTQAAPTPPAVPKEQMKEGRGGTDSQGNHWTVRGGQLVMDKK